jgi:hypothetical protein
MERPLNFFFGHHKGATTWVRYLIERICNLRGDRWAVFDNPSQFSDDLLGTIAERCLDFVAYTNANRRFLTDLPPFRGFHLVRDPRDILVSAYFSHRNSHPVGDWKELEGHRQRLQELSIEDGLLAEMEFSAGVFEDIESWDYNQPNVLELKFEDLVENPYRTMLEAFAFLGMISDESATTRSFLILALHEATGFLEGRMKGRLRALGHLKEVPAEVLLATIHQKRFSKLTQGRRRGEEAVGSHYRKGLPGDWRNHFSLTLEAKFTERYGDLLGRLGYD